jgi:hypothetical protein
MGNPSAPDSGSQLQLPMLHYVDGPVLVDNQRVLACSTYREAVRTCWELRTRLSLTRAALAADTGLHPPHVTDYLHKDDARRDLPAKYIEVFECACGNRCISQWIAARARLPIDQEQLQLRAA